MESSKLAIKFYLAEGSTLKFADVVPVLHSWIQFHSIPDHLLIDVADYAHVPEGPGILLVSHEANIYIDDLDGRRGLTYSRKTPLPGNFTERLQATLRTALQAVQLLEENIALPGVKFDTSLASFKINDRLFAPNTPETLAAVKPALQTVLTNLYEGDVALEHRADPKRLFEVSIRAASSPDAANLLKRLGDQPANV